MGVGLEITTNLLSKNYGVYAINRTISNDLNKLLKKYPNSLKIIQYDLSNVENIDQAIFKDSIGFKNKIYGIVNNAAYAYDDIITNADYSELKKTYTLNVISPIILTKYMSQNNSACGGPNILANFIGKS